MKRVLLTVAATIGVFALGVLTGRWMQSTQPLPPPPIGMMGEIRDMPLSGRPFGFPPRELPRDAPQLRAELQRMGPAIAEFRRQIEPIKLEFRQNLEALLTSEQRDRLLALDERFADRSFKAEALPEGPPPRLRRPHDGFDSLFPLIMVPATLDRLVEELSLDEAQTTAVRALLLKRRQRFLDLVDTNPPPSLNLWRIAPLVPQIAQPPSK